MGNDRTVVRIHPLAQERLVGTVFVYKYKLIQWSYRVLGNFFFETVCFLLGFSCTRSRAFPARGRAFFSPVLYTERFAPGRVTEYETVNRQSYALIPVAPVGSVVALTSPKYYLYVVGPEFRSNHSRAFF